MLVSKLCKLSLNKLRLKYPITRIISSSYIQRRNASDNVLQTLHKRGILQSVFPEEEEHDLAELINSSRQCIYAGFDPTSDSLHIGNLLVIIALLHCQRAGHDAILLLGGATARIGDPSGRTTEREQLDDDIINYNIQSIKESLQRITANHQKYFWDTSHKVDLSPIRILDNSLWYEDKNAIEFLRNTGHYFRMGQMLNRTSVQTRLNSKEGMSFSEFSYQVFQAYDWLHLSNTYNCRLQLGGCDQLGNMYAGYDLISKIQKRKVYGLAIPLVKSDAGDKYGKSAGNAIWLNKKTSPYEMYQFFYRLHDSEVERYLKYFTFYSLNEVETIVQKHLKNPETHYGQKKIAEAVVLLVHGEEGLKLAKVATEAIFNHSAESIAQLSAEDLKQVFNQASYSELPRNPGTTVLEMALRAKCFLREEDAVRIIRAGGLHINQLKITSPKAVLIDGQHILPNGISLVRVGKRNYSLIKWLGFPT